MNERGPYRLSHREPPESGAKASPEAVRLAGFYRLSVVRGYCNSLLRQGNQSAY